tara:strand:- start:84 stop:821 length:738 start_codon:yes stop_codon:yes gene_type:complete
MNFEDLITKKKVALVGPAAYMVGSNLGTEIDKHDVVVRINRGIELLDKYKEDVGQKSDVLYSCLIEKAANAGKVRGKTLKEKYGVKYLCAPPESTFQGIAHKTKFHHLVNRSTVNEIKEYLPVRIVDHGLHTVLAQKVNCRPNTGFLAIYDLLKHKPEKLSIYGFSFYLDGFIPGCKEGVYQEQNKNEKQFADQCFTSKRHIQENMWVFAQKTLLDKENIYLDPTLKKILTLEALDRDLFKKNVL